MNRIAWTERISRRGIFIPGLLLILAAGTSFAQVDLAVIPTSLSVDQGEIFDVELTVTGPGADFNAFDAVVGFDSDMLTFIELSASEQKGPLMTSACPNSFHVFDVGPGGDTLEISYVLLCSGTTVTGPGVIYRLRFQAQNQDALTYITLLPGTAFYRAGIFVNPVNTSDAAIQIGEISAVGDDFPAGLPNLMAAPNPFNPMTTISFDAPQSMTARVTVYTTRGSRVLELMNGPVSAGTNSVTWDGRNNQGLRVGSGVYMVHLEMGDQSYMHRITLLK